jgi:hypothetical protein
VSSAEGGLPGEGGLLGKRRVARATKLVVRMMGQATVLNYK